MQFTNSLPPSVFSSRSILGQAVVTPDGTAIGRVQDLVIDPVEMRIAFAIVDIEKPVLDFPERQIAFPIELLEADSENHRFILRLPLSPAAQSFPGEASVDAFDLEPPEIMPFRYQGNPHRN